MVSSVTLGKPRMIFNTGLSNAASQPSSLSSELLLFKPPLTSGSSIPAIFLQNQIRSTQKKCIFLLFQSLPNRIWGYGQIIDLIAFVSISFHFSHWMSFGSICITRFLKLKTLKTKNYWKVIKLNRPRSTKIILILLHFTHGTYFSREFQARYYDINHIKVNQLQTNFIAFISNSFRVGHRMSFRFIWVEYIRSGVNSEILHFITVIIVAAGRSVYRNIKTILRIWWTFFCYKSINKVSLNQKCRHGLHWNQIPRYLSNEILCSPVY